MNKCIDCKHLNKELAFCRACGAKWINEKDGENCKYFEKVTAPTLFHRITESPEALAEKLVYRYDGNGTWRSFLLYGYEFLTKEESLAATVAKLKEVCHG